MTAVHRIEVTGRSVLATAEKDVSEGAILMKEEGLIGGKDHGSRCFRRKQLRALKQISPKKILKQLLSAPSGSMER